MKVNDTINKYNIFSDKITYKKNEEVIFSTGNSKAIDNNQKILKQIILLIIKNTF